MAIKLLNRIIRHRARLTLAIGVGVGIAFALPSIWPLTTRALVAWNVGVWLYLLLIIWLMVNAHHSEVRRIAQQEHPSRLAELTIMSLAAFASLAVIILELTTLHDLTPHQRLIHYAFTGVTVFGSWCVIGVLFTLHYAHLFYIAPEGQPALVFSDKEPNPDYWDFLYLSLTIAVAAQTSDILIMTRSARKTVMAQSILSFVFNVSIVGLSINIIAGLLNA